MNDTLKEIKNFFIILFKELLFIEDIKFINCKIEGKPYTKPENKYFDFKTFLWYMIIVIAFFSGFFVASQQYQDKCNQYIQETYHGKYGHVTCDPFLEGVFIDISSVEVDREHHLLDRNTRYPDIENMEKIDFGYLSGKDDDNLS